MSKHRKRKIVPKLAEFKLGKPHTPRHHLHRDGGRGQRPRTLVKQVKLCKSGYLFITSIM